jgi:hypothetical protein
MNTSVDTGVCFLHICSIDIYVDADFPAAPANTCAGHASARVLATHTNYLRRFVVVDPPRRVVMFLAT